MALPTSRQQREYNKFVENLAGKVAVRVVPTDASGADMLKLEDAQHVSGDPGVQSLAVRNDTLAALGGTDGDYAPLQVDASGALYVVTTGTGAGQYAEDIQHTDADIGNFVFAVRNDALASLCTTDGDYVGLQVTAAGALYTDLSEVLGATMSATNGGFMNITDNTTVAAVTAGLTALKVDLVGEGGAAIDATNPVFAELTDGTTAIGTANPLTVSISDATSIVDIGVDESTMAATPNFLPVGGEYRPGDTTYSDGDATVLQSDVNGYTKTRSKAYDAGTTSDKAFEVNPIDEHYVEEELVDTTNLAADTYHYPSATGRPMENFNNVSIHYVLTGGVTFTLEAKIDDSTDWVDITPAGFDLSTNTTGNASFIDLSGIVAFDDLHVRHIRIVSVTSDATNGVQYHWKLTAI